VVALLPALITVTPAVVALLLFWGLAGWAFVPGQQHRLITAIPRAAAMLLAGHGSAVQLGFAVGALAGGLVIDAAGASRLWLVPLTASAPAMIGCLYRPRSRP
jgi:predicted MFS family arabinose efflux permease